MKKLHSPALILILFLLFGLATILEPKYTYADPGRCVGGIWRGHQVSQIFNYPGCTSVGQLVPDPDNPGRFVRCDVSNVCDRSQTIASESCTDYNNTDANSCQTVGGDWDCDNFMTCYWVPGTFPTSTPRVSPYLNPTAGPTITPRPNATATPTPIAAPTPIPGQCLPLGSGPSSQNYCPAACGRQFGNVTVCLDSDGCGRSCDAWCTTCGTRSCDIGCGCAEQTCVDSTGCPAGLLSCSPQVSHNVVSNNNCVSQLCQQPQVDIITTVSGCWTHVDRRDPCTTGDCIYSRSSSCSENVTRTLCNQTGCCGGVIPPGPCNAPSTIIEIDLQEQTGTAIRDPIVPFVVDDIQGSFGNNPCPQQSAGGTINRPSIDCSNQIFVSGVQQTIRCTVTLPNLCPIAGSVRLQFDIDGHTPVDRQFNYLDRTTYRYQQIVPYTAAANSSPGNYVKLSGASFISRPGTTLTNVIPHAPLPFNDPSEPNPLTPLNYAFSSANAAGAITNADIGDVILRHTNSTVGNIHNEGYIARATWTIEDILGQTGIASRAVLKVTGSPPTLQQGEIYELSTPASTESGIGALNIPSVPAGRKKGVVILVRDPVSRALGNVKITANIPSNTPSLMIAGNQITVAANVTEVNAILIANQITFETTPVSDASGLKIVGNMVARQGFTNGRRLADTARPSVFMKYDVVKYLDLMPLIKNKSSVGNMQQE